MATLDDLLRRLKGVKRTGDRTYLALCPAHEDTNPSLTVREAADGKTLFKGHAGCSFSDIVRALGLSQTDCFPNNGRRSGSSRWTQDEAEAALRQRGLREDTIKRFHIVADLNKQAWRFRVTKGVDKYKAFPTGSRAKYWWAEKGKAAPICHLKPCKGVEEAYLVEGEPDVWIMWQAGLKAFSFTGGAGTVTSAAVKEVAEAGIGMVHIV